MARPKRDPAEKRSERVMLRLTLAEHEYVLGQAQAAGLSVSAFLRRRSLGLPVAPPRGRVDAAVLSELNRIGVNLNQVAKTLNAGAQVPGLAESVISELREVLAKVAADGP